jgi:hypothetical protein
MGSISNRGGKNQAGFFGVAAKNSVLLDVKTLSEIGRCRV